MTITYESLLAEQTKHRAAFGKMLRSWRKANKWWVHDPARLAEQCGFRPVPYGLWQQLEDGAAGELQSVTFMALGELNRQPDIKSLGDRDGGHACWSAVEFWACYCGLRPVPPRWQGTVSNAQ